MEKVNERYMKRVEQKKYIFGKLFFQEDKDWHQILFYTTAIKILGVNSSKTWRAIITGVVSYSQVC